MADPSIEDLSKLPGLSPTEEDPFAGLGEDYIEEKDPFAKIESRYEMDPALTPERIEELGDLTNISELIPEASTLEQFEQIALNMITPDAMELADILTTRFPEVLDVRVSPEGVPVVRNMQTEKEFAINKPGFSAMDVLQGIGMVGMYYPATRFAAAPLHAAKKKLVGTAAKQVKKAAVRRAAVRASTAEGATEYAAQKAQEASGGRMDPGDVAFSALIAPVPEVLAGPIGNLARKSYETLKGRGNWPESIAQGLKFAEEHGFKVASTDALADAIRGPRKIFLRGSERIPLIGTGGMRLTQIAQRADALEVMFNRMKLDPSTDYGALILNSFVRRKGQLVTQSNKLRQTAFRELADAPSLQPEGLLKKIDDEYAAAAKLEPDQRQALEGYLDRIQKDLQDRMRLGKFSDFSFEDGTILLNSLFKDEALGTLHPGLKGELKGRLGDSLYQDLKKHATDNSATAFNAWETSRNVWQKDLKKIADEHLAKAISTGEISEPIIDQVFRSGKSKDMRALARVLDPAGRELVKKRIFAHALSSAGGVSGDMKKVNIPRLIHILDTDKNMQKAVKEFWSTEERGMLDGMKEYLRLTNDAAKSMEGLGLIASGGTGRIIGGMLAIMFPPTLGMAGAARLHESNVARNLMLNLRHAKGISDKTQGIMAELRPLMMALGNQYLDEGRDPFAPEVEATAFEKFLKGTGRTGSQMWEAISGFRLPGGGEEEGGADAAGRRLLQMKQQMIQ